MAGLLFIITSAASTAVGASATIASAKIWSTLGGTSALGAVTATVNANESDDQTSLASISATLADFRKFVTSGGQNGAPPPNQVIANVASTYAAQCVAAAATTAPQTTTGIVAPTTAPTTVVATPGAARTVSVAFVAAASTGGAAITGYTVVATPSGGAPAITVTGTASPITVNGLTTGTSYTFTVAASNSAGTGPVSAPSSAVVAP